MPGEHRGREARDDGRFAGREVGRFALILGQVVQERLRAIVLTEEFPIAIADREVGLRGRQRGRPCLPVGGRRQQSDLGGTGEVPPSRVADRSTPSSPSGAGSPAIRVSEGARSMAAKTEAASVPPIRSLAMRPGAQTMSEERRPPSKICVLLPRNGPALPAPGSGPLSEQMMKTVLARRAGSARTRSKSRPSWRSISSSTAR